MRIHAIPQQRPGQQKAEAQKDVNQRVTDDTTRHQTRLYGKDREFYPGPPKPGAEFTRWGVNSYPLHALSGSSLTSIPAPLREGSGIVRYLLIGDEDRFFDAVEVWVESRERPIVTVLDSPLLNPLRSDPRMVAVRERMGLPP